MKEPPATNEHVKKTMQGNTKKNTSIEVLFRKSLWHRGIRYRKNCKDVLGTPDVGDGLQTVEQGDAQRGPHVFAQVVFQLRVERLSGIGVQRVVVSGVQTRTQQESGEKGSTGLTPLVSGCLHLIAHDF